MSERTLILAGHAGRLAPAGAASLEREGTDVQVVHSVAQVHAVVRGDRPELIVVGSDLEDGTILSLVHQIRERRNIRQPSILLVSSPLEEARIRQILDAGANAWLPRPLEVDSFDATVSSLLTVRHRQAFRVLVRMLSSVGDIHFGETRNLSLSGMMIETGVAIAEGETLEFSFFLPGEKTRTELRGDVVRTEDDEGSHRLGIRFVDPPDEALQAIERFVERRLHGHH